MWPSGSYPGIKTHFVESIIMLSLVMVGKMMPVIWHPGNLCSSFPCSNRSPMFSSRIILAILLFSSHIKISFSLFLLLPFMPFSWLHALFLITMKPSVHLSLPVSEPFLFSLVQQNAQRNNYTFLQFSLKNISADFHHQQYTNISFKVTHLQTRCNDQILILILITLMEAFDKHT